MKYDIDATIDYLDNKLVHLKDRSIRPMSGKYASRPKAEKPQNSYLAKLVDECKKEAIRDVEVCKRRISKARFKRLSAEAEGRVTHRQEVRWYKCYKHVVPQFHLTKLAENEYYKKVECSKRREYANVS